MAASPRTRVQRRLLDASAASPKGTYEPHFLRNVLSPQNRKSGQFSSPTKNKVRNIDFFMVSDYETMTYVT